MKKIAVIVAGGAGNRMQSNIPKQFLRLNNKPVLWYTIHAFAHSFADMEMIIVLPLAYMEEGRSIVGDLMQQHSIQFVEGGDTRFHSVKNALQLIKEDAIVFVHDGVRCLVSEHLIRNCYKQASEKGSAIPCIKATDSIRLIDGGKNKLLNREDIRIVQTPQTFTSALLLPAFQQTYQSSFTDEASVVEAFGKEVFLMGGEPENIKITRPVDLIVAEKMLEGR